MLFTPKWARSLPSNLRPDKKRINELERLRIQYKIPHEAMAICIGQSKTTTRKVQQNALRYFRLHSPNSSEKELLKMVLISRLQISQLTNPYDLPIYAMTEEAIDKVMDNINSFDALVDYIIGLDEQEPSLPDQLGIGKTIDEILAQEKA